jgi:carboxylesterase type B
MVQLVYLVYLTVLGLAYGSQLTPCHHHPASTNNTYILTTANGKVKGNCQFTVTTDASNRTRATNVYSWLAIPFAEPPGRFEAPRPKSSWGDRVLDGTRYAKTCFKLVDQSLSDSKQVFSGHRMWIPSPNHTQLSEDCLYLNLWLPASAYRNLTQKQNNSAPGAPIMVFIHGSSGTTALDIYNPSVFVATTGIIVVQITYRSHMFGFFTLGDAAQGNQALLDQYMAIKWVHDNAEYFGGDNRRVTLNGVSYGAMTASLHLQYKPSWPLFRNLILQAGSGLNPNILPVSKQAATEQNRAFLIAIGCGNATSPNAVLLECARRQEPARLMTQSIEHQKNLLAAYKSFANNLFVFYSPVIDGDILTESFVDALRNQNLKKCPIITGFTTDEGKSLFDPTEPNVLNLFRLKGSSFFPDLIGYETNQVRQKPSIDLNKLSEYVEAKFYFYPRYPYKNHGSVAKQVLTVG